MKKTIALIFAASTLLLAGCCTTSHATKWEYKVAQAPNPLHITPPGGASTEERLDLQQAFLNELGKDGWMLTSQAEGRVFYFKRPIK